MAKLHTLMSVLLVASFVSCQQNDFSGDAGAAIQKGPKKPGSGDGNPDDPNGLGGPNDPLASDDLKTDEGGQSQITPKSCDTSNIKFISNDGQCPAGSAAYAADDSKGVAVACCPLPALDMIASGAPVSRGQSCGPNEVVVGVSAGSFLCAPINTERYSLKAPTATCYYGSGSSGGSGAAKCTAPSALLAAMTQPYGTDACLPVPYGGLITSRTSKYCRDVKASQLVFKADGAPVPMFK